MPKTAVYIPNFQVVLNFCKCTYMCVGVCTNAYMYTDPPPPTSLPTLYSYLPPTSLPTPHSYAPPPPPIPIRSPHWYLCYLIHSHKHDLKFALMLAATNCGFSTCTICRPSSRADNKLWHNRSCTPCLHVHVHEYVEFSLNFSCQQM